VGTYDGTTQRLYVNGVLRASRAQTGPMTVNSNPLVIGSWDTQVEHFAGTIDEVAVYKRVFGGPRVRAHYTAGMPTSVTAPAARAAAGVEPNLRIRRHVGPVRVARGRDPELVTRRFDGRLVRLVCPLDARRAHRAAERRARAGDR
jgi:hypothetical protein